MKTSRRGFLGVGLKAVGLGLASKALGQSGPAAPVAAVEAESSAPEMDTSSQAMLEGAKLASSYANMSVTVSFINSMPSGSGHWVQRPDGSWRWLNNWEMEDALD